MMEEITKTQWKLMPEKEGQMAPIVFREWSDGRFESCFVTAPEYVKWLEEGNAPLPADGSVE